MGREGTAVATIPAGRLTRPTIQDFQWLDKELRALGFHPITVREVREDFDRSKIEMTKPHEGGREEGYAISHGSGYRVKVWTSFLATEQAYRMFDQGWVIIVDHSDNIIYRAQSTRRTKNFVQNLLMRARMARERVIHRPYCNGKGGCGQWMHFIQLKNRGCFWVCKNEAHHGKQRPRKGPDISLSSTVKTFANKKRKDRERDRHDPRRKSPRGNGLGNYRSKYKTGRAKAQK